MKKIAWHLLLLFGPFIGSAVNALADVKLPALISDGMVLQQGVRVPLWGWADDGEAVTVQFQGQKVSATAEGGKWTLYLKPLRAGGPFTLTVAGKNRIELKNVLVGEVWVASGQSNMQWALRQSENADAEIAAAKYPLIRLFQVPRLEADAPQDDVKAKWQECSPESVAAFSAVAYYFGRELHKRRGVPVGLINSSVGGTPAESWTREAVLNADADFRKLVEAYPQRMEQYQKALEAHRAAVEKAKAEGKPEPRAPGRPWKPAALYNGMIAPLIPYAIKGAIWYQGESNAGRAYQYRSLFPAMIRNWRDDWRQGDFPFLFVQLAPFGPNGDKLGESDWAELREAQLMTLSRVPQTGMAVITDYGVYDDIHPKAKRPVGERLALAARAVAYGEKIVYSGPIYEAMKVDGNKVILSFKHTGGGLEARGGELKGFIVAGEDKVWREAKAEIRGREVVVMSPDVARPVAVRYGWAKFPVVNLYNKEGLPASPFRTDDWPGVTAPQAPTTSNAMPPQRQLPAGTRVLSDMAYVTNGHERQKLDLYLPAQGTNLPLVIWVHGGAFRGGSKNNPPALRLLDQGYAVASINYRLSQHAVFPAQIEDCKAAVRWLRANARQHGIDPNRFGAWGASAGGHLVAMLGTAGEVKAFEVGENLGVSSRVQAVVDYFGPTDFLQMDAHRPPDGMVHNLPDSPESQLVGGHIQENKEKVARANPITYVTPGDAPFLIVHGDRDPLVPHHQSELLRDALKRAGVSVDFYTVKGGGHGGFKDPNVEPMVDAFLAKHLKQAASKAAESGGVPPGFTPIFNGQDLSGWHVSKTNHHGTTPDWRVVSGVLVGTQQPAGKGGILLTDRKYKNFEVYLELKPDWGCDGGLFLRANEAGQAYQVMLDYLPGGIVGGIYGERLQGVERQAVPDWEKHWKREEWNALRVRVTGDAPRITVWLSGTQILDWTDTANHAADGAKEGVIAVQVHGGRRWVDGGFHRFRNIAVKELED